MAHYYAFCQLHKKCGPKRDANAPNALEQAWADCEEHATTVDAPHGSIYPKLSNILTLSNGAKRYEYKAIKTK